MVKMRRLREGLVFFLVLVCFLGNACSFHKTVTATETFVSQVNGNDEIDLESIPKYCGDPFVELNQNQPDFQEAELTNQSYEIYSELDELGRCQTAIANIGTDLMPMEERKSINEVTPSGWHSVQYDNIEGDNLYNRCHLIGYQLSGENANEENLITGTRYMNVEGMLPFENMVANYVKETNNHVLYQVTPIFEGENLVASGVHMEAESVEDGGEGISFNVYCYNVQPGIVIDYATGESKEEESGLEENVYILNTNTHKFHLLSCSSVKKINEDNRQEYKGERKDLIEQGYTPCGICHT